jgi:hypothetical protein
MLASQANSASLWSLREERQEPASPELRLGARPEPLAGQEGRRPGRAAPTPREPTVAPTEAFGTFAPTSYSSATGNWQLRASEVPGSTKCPWRCRPVRRRCLVAVWIGFDGAPGLCRTTLRRPGPVRERRSHPSHSPPPPDTAPIPVRNSRDRARYLGIGEPTRSRGRARSPAVAPLRLEARSRATSGMPPYRPSRGRERSAAPRASRPRWRP